MNLTLSLLLLARQLQAAPVAPTVSGADLAPLRVELLPADPLGTRAVAHVGIDADELVIEASQRDWTALRQFFDASVADRGHVLRIMGLHRDVDGLAGRLAETNPHLDVSADGRTGSIVATSRSQG